MPVLFFDAKHPICPKIVADIPEQNRAESRRLWQKVSEAIIAKDYTRASEEKHKLEEDQRHLAKVRSENGLDWQPNFFRLQNDGQWVLIEKNLYLQIKRLLTLLVVDSARAEILCANTLTTCLSAMTLSTTERLRNDAIYSN